mgnify:CR=1 FL=1
MTTRVPTEDSPNRTPDPPEKDRDRDGNEAPETPPTEPAPVPVQEPPNQPGTRVPYVVD